MVDSIVNFGDLSKPATVLVEKIAEAVGGLFKPYQIVRVAKAEAEADHIRAAADIQIEDIHRRALHRFLIEEGVKQRNMEAIAAKALPQVTDGAEPEGIEKDWITNFFDKCRLISDDEMQDLWSRVLAGEATTPGKFSKRTVTFLSSLDKTDAQLFIDLCGFCWNDGHTFALVFDVVAPIYAASNINFGTLTHLDAIGLLRFDPTAGFARKHLPKRHIFSYYGRTLGLRFENDSNNLLPIGTVLLTRVGMELASICGATAVEGFFEYVERQWTPYLDASGETSPPEELK